jgi:hypothetical protein
MADWTMFIVAGFLFLLLGLHFLWQGWMKKVRRAKLEVMAAALRLELSEQNLSETQARFTGRSRGSLVKLLVGPMGGCDIRILVDAPLPAGLLLSRPGGMGRDIQLGLPELDKVIQIQGAHPAGIIRFLREPALRAPLRELFEQHPEARVAGGEVFLPASALWGDEDLALAAQRAAKAAQALSAAARALAPASDPAPEGTEASGALESTEWVRETFARRRRIYVLGLGAFSIGGVAAAFVAVMVMPWSKTLKYSWMCAWIAVALFSWWFAARVMRCPACSGAPRNLVEEEEGRHVPLHNPVICADCGVQLR